MFRLADTNDRRIKATGMAAIALATMGLMSPRTVIAAPPIFQFANSDKNATDRAADSLPRVGPGVTQNPGSAYFDGSADAFVDLGNGAAEELRLVGRVGGEPVETMTIWARVSAAHPGDTVLPIVARWGDDVRSYLLCIKGDRILAGFTTTGDWSNSVEPISQRPGVIKRDGTQTIDIAARFDHGRATIFLNGKEEPANVQQAGQCVSILSTNERAKTVVGAIIEPNQKEAAVRFQGIINDVRIYREALADADIEALSNDLAQTAARNIETLKQVEPAETPDYVNRKFVHATVEPAAPGKYLSICPSLCELADGTLLIAYHRTSYVDFNGAYSIWLRSSKDGGLHWSAPRLVAENLQAPGLVRLKSGDLLLNGAVALSDRSTTMKLFRSTDQGQTWVEQKPIWERSKGMLMQGGCGSLVELSSGRILCPYNGSEINYADNCYSGCYYSDDQGKTWQAGTGKVELTPGGAEEPSVAECRDGTLRMAVRTRVGFVYVARSDDAGITWSKPWSTGLETPQNTVGMTTFPGTDRLLLSYTSGKHDPKHHHGGERTPFSLAISDDAGLTWRRIEDVLGGPHEFGASGSNSICMTSKGKVIIAIDWHRLAWNRDLKTGGVRVAIADQNWLLNH